MEEKKKLKREKMWIHIVTLDNSDHQRAHISILRAMGAEEKVVSEDVIAFTFEELPLPLQKYRSEWFEGDWEKIEAMKMERKRLEEAMKKDWRGVAITMDEAIICPNCEETTLQSNSQGQLYCPNCNYPDNWR